MAARDLWYLKWTWWLLILQTPMMSLGMFLTAGLPHANALQRLHVSTPGGLFLPLI
jgi:hypothetical protein